MRRLAVLVLSATWLLVATSGAQGSAHCRSVSGTAGGAGSIHVSTVIGCGEARAEIKGWLNLGAMEAGPAPWQCSHSRLLDYRCHLTTTFGATKPEQTFHLNFTVYDN